MLQKLNGILNLPIILKTVTTIYQEESQERLKGDKSSLEFKAYEKT